MKYIGPHNESFPKYFIRLGITTPMVNSFYTDRFQQGNIHELIRVFGYKLEWCEKNCPDFSLTSFVDVSSMRFEWIVYFENEEELIYYKLTHGYDNE